MRDHVHSPSIPSFQRQELMHRSVAHHTIKPFLKESEGLKRVLEIEVNLIIFDRRVEEREIDFPASLSVFILNLVR